MKILPLPNSLSNLQKCHLPMTCFAEFGKHFNKYAILGLESSRCVVQISFKTDLHELYCHLDATVGLYADFSTSLLFYKNVDVSTIVPLDGPFEAKSINVSLVFEKIEDLVEWKKKVNVHVILYNFLRLFGVYNGCHISLKTLNEYFKLGFNLITINNVELRGKSKRHDLGETVIQVVSSTYIIIDSELTKNMLRLKNISDIGGFEKPYSLLKEIVHQNRMLKGTGMNINKNVLLIGPSGCGKKTLVRKVAHDCGALLIEINCSEALSPKDSRGRPGEVEENIRKLFGLVRTLCEQLISEENMFKCSTSSTKRKGTVQKNFKNGHSPIVFLLLIQLDLMCPNRKHSSGKRMIGQTTQVLNSIEDLKELNNVLVFATTYKVDDLDPAIRRPGRLDTEVFIGIPTEEERSLILEKLVTVDADEEKDVKMLAKFAAALTPGRVAADLSLLCQEVKRIRSMRKISTNLDSQKVSRKWLEDFAQCATKLPVSTLLQGPGTLMNYENLNSSRDQRPCLSSIGGLASVKNRLLLSIKEPLVHPEGFQRLGIRPPKGVLFYGPPGCAKTTLARALAMPDSSSHKQSVEPSITFISCSAAELYSPYVGESEKKVIELFQRARAGAPSIIFIDELDALFGSREAMQKGGVQERVLSALLTEMDGVGHRMIAPKASLHDDGDQMVMEAEENMPFQEKYNKENYASNEFSSLVTIIAATNRPDLIDAALLRPGRLDQLMFIPPPNEDGRFEILSYYTANMPVHGDREPILKSLAKCTELFSGADLKNLCKEAALYAITVEGFDVQEVQEKHFLTALKFMRPSLTIDQILSYDNFSKNKFK